MKQKFKLPVTWEVSGEIEVEAESLEAAINNFDPDNHALPKGEYVDGSFRLTDTDPDNVRTMTDQE